MEDALGSTAHSEREKEAQMEYSHIKVFTRGIGDSKSTILFSLLIILTFAAVGKAQTPAPAIFFTDIASGPNSGGEGVASGGTTYSGPYVTIYGNNFGATQGSGTITLNGANCLRVVSWGTPWLWYQKISVQLGPSCSSGNLTVTTSAGASNGVPFAVRSGNIYCISVGGSDSASGKFPSSCWSTMAKSASTMVAGDIVYLENGVLNTTISAFSAVVNIETSGTAASPIAFLAYPGATATIGDIHSSTYGIRTPNIGTNPNYIVIAGLSVRGQEAIDAPSGMDHWWFIGNDLSCDGSNGYGCHHVGSSTNIFDYGNYMHDVGYSCSSNTGNPTGAPCKYHGIYMTTNTSHVWIGWNIVDMNPAKNTNAGCYGIQAYSTGGSDQYDWHVHDNIVRNVVCGGINLSTMDPDNGTVEAYNNVLYHVGTGPDPSGSLANYPCMVTSSGSSNPTTPVLVYNNSLYDCGARGGGSNVGAYNFLIPTKMQNNIVQLTGSSEGNYFWNTSCSVLSGSNNDWFGNGAAPCTSNVTSSLNVDPKYVSTTLGSQDLHVQSTSPMIGAGAAISGLIYDHDGLLRSSPPSIGGYEFSSAPAAQKPNPPTITSITVQ
jgi:hypothetical protein